jgi:hypothetical protein
VVNKDDEVAHFQHVAEILYVLVDGQQFAVICAVFLLGRVIFLEKKAKGCQAFWTRCLGMAPMADVEASVTSASGADGSGCACRVACDKLALHSSKALMSSGVQVMGWEPLTLGPERTS